MKEFAYNHVGLGGSFDHLHEGHKYLLKTAFKLGKMVYIALTTEELIGSKRFKDQFQSYSVRSAHLRAFITQELRISTNRFSIIPLKDPLGPAITFKDLEVHVSSMETYSTAIKINEIRLKNGLTPLILVIIPLICTSSGKKISSTKIRENLAQLSEQNLEKTQ
ncbi:MAG: pantetheine-phosphate adenylyltransferase [Candidatus Lokiarchaeota archaeon]|nr:pantetheine-phosphate adenylyltransferase [Candidatus Harpocratesius repetitus]